MFLQGIAREERQPFVLPNFISRSPGGVPIEPVNDESKPKQRSPLHFIFRHPLSLETETSWFLLLGVLDLVLTTILLNTGVVHEVNPLARFFLFAGGVHGLIGYKCSLLAVAAVATQLIMLRRPKVAKAVLHTGIVLQFFVVTYSLSLLLRVTA